MPEMSDPWWLDLPACHACGHLASRHRSGIMMAECKMTATFKECKEPGCSCAAYAMHVPNPRTSFRVSGFNPNPKKEKP